MDFTKSQLIYCLIGASFEHEARAADRDWSEFYADEIVERYAASEPPVLRITSAGGEDRSTSHLPIPVARRDPVPELSPRNRTD